MIIDYFNIIHIVVPPDKADAPLLVDADAVLAEPVSFQALQSVARRNSQAVQGNNGIEQLQLDPRRFSNGFGSRFTLMSLKSFSVSLQRKLMIIGASYEALRAASSRMAAQATGHLLPSLSKQTNVTCVEKISGLPSCCGLATLTATR